MLIDWLSVVYLKLIMGLDIPDRSPKCPTPGMTVIGVTDVMLVIYQTKIPVFQLHIMDVPDVLCVIADKCHIIGIRNDHSEIFPVDCLQLFRDKHDYHLAPGSATI